MKRSYSREEEGDDHDSEMDRLDTANCLVLLARRTHPASQSPGRVFECKTCNRQFQSFQALGGHRASHKRAKLVEDHNLDRAANNPHTSLKVHECAICGTEFAMGQALGGHMRRHRAEAESFSVAKKSNGTMKRLYLDLNLPPSEMDGDFLGIGLVGKFSMVH